MSEKYPNAYGRPDAEMDAIYADGDHLSETLDDSKVTDVTTPLAEQKLYENWEAEDRAANFIDFKEAA